MNIKIQTNTEGEFLAVAGGNYRIIISGEETNGGYAVIEMLVPPGGGPPPHAHPDMQELFYVIEGEFEFKTESGAQLLGAGGLVNIPFGGAIHCFKNVSGHVGRLLCTVMPAGLEQLFKEIGEPVAAGQFLPIPAPTPERMALIQAMDEKYHQTTYPRDFLDNKNK